MKFIADTKSYDPVLTRVPRFKSQICNSISNRLFRKVRKILSGKTNIGKEGEKVFIRLIEEHL
jgi:hypothetical protein